MIRDRESNREGIEYKPEEAIEKVKEGVQKLEANLKILKGKGLILELQRKEEVNHPEFSKDAEYYKGWLLQHLNLVKGLKEILGEGELDTEHRMDPSIIEFLKNTKSNINLIESSLNEVQLLLENRSS